MSKKTAIFVYIFQTLSIESEIVTSQENPQKYPFNKVGLFRSFLKPDLWKRGKIQQTESPCPPEI